ncbi:MAG: hypothetical protein JWO52_3182 [Gammaproteobacteria bacterium]|nr:hypothetical protein [Gammaproteobacteria bacterium]
MTVNGPMTDDEIVDAIRQNRAAVVHFSHHSNMRPGGTFPDDLLDAIINKARWALSCHVLWPKHGMDVVGSVGLLLEVTSASQVISVRSDDSGSLTLPDGSDHSLGVPFSKQSFEDTFNLTGAYNEWRVKDAGIKGIFVANPRAIYAKTKKDVGEGEHRQEIIAAEQIELATIEALFTNHDLYTMGINGLQLLRPKHAVPDPSQ